MENEVFIKQGKLTSKNSNQMFLSVDNNLVEKNKQSLIYDRQAGKNKEQAEKEEQWQSVFFANMIHEIRTQICAIKSFTQFLKTPDLPVEDKEEYSQIIDRCADDLLNLVNDLLDISKIEAGRLTIVEKPGNLKELFNELFDMFEVSVKHYRSNNVQLKSHIGLTPEQCMTITDFTRIKQIFINLIGNALKFTHNGHILFGCRLIGPKTIQFYVEDTGIGIIPEMQEVIFERYKQVNDTHAASSCKGSGLGLSIVQSLVRLMEGNVWVESVHGVGSTFYFTLPYKKVKSVADKMAC